MKYLIKNGMNIGLKKAWKGKKGQAMKFYNYNTGKTKHEVRFDVSDDPIDETDLPDISEKRLKWFVKRGCLELYIDPVENPEPEPVEVSNA